MRVRFRSGGAEQHFDAATFAVQWAAGTRRIARLDAELGSGRSLRLTPSGPVFAMSGLGYTHPVWGHGLDHGPDLAVGHDSLSEAERGWGNQIGRAKRLNSSPLMRISYAVFCLKKKIIHHKYKQQ